MRNQYPLIEFLTARLAPAAIAISTCLAVGSAQATVIDFDDLVFNPDQECFCDSPLTDEYLAQGLRIDGGFLAQWEGTTNNYLFGGNWLELSFVGSLPTFVSMNVGAALADVIYLDAYGPAGYSHHKHTTGYAGPYNDTPYEPNQYISFTSATGISSIIIQDFYNYRVDAQIDNLTFTYDAIVPEPSTFMLFGAGLGLMAVTRRRNGKDRFSQS